MIKLIEDTFSSKGDVINALNKKFGTDFHVMKDRKQSMGRESEETKRNEVLQILERYHRHVNEGFEKIKSLAKNDPILAKLVRRIENAPHFTPEDLKEKTVRTLLNVDDRELKQLYHLGSNAINSKDGETALGLFSFFTWLNPKNYAGWLGYGMAFSSLGDEDSAVFFFEDSITIDPEQPSSYLYAANSYFRLGDIKKGTEYTDKAQSLAKKATKQLGNV